MDTITQITLGAAVGEAVLGRKIGNKAPLWGAVFGIVPDLDVLATPFVSEVQALAIHRGFSHSIVFSLLAAPLFGWVLHKCYRSRYSVGWRPWMLLVFLVLITHIFIDTCTSYGTQVFQPFSNYPLSFNSIFIIDPLYTLPLMAGIGTALFLRRDSRARRWTNSLGLAVSTLYLLWGFAAKVHVSGVFEQNFKAKKIHPQQYITTPTPFNTFLWTGYAVANDTLYAGLYSVFDKDSEISFQAIPQREELLAPFGDQLPVERVRWFSQGYYSAEKDSAGRLLVHDLRFGRSDLWLKSGAAPFVWTYRLQLNKDSTRVTGFKQLDPNFEINHNTFGDLWDRTFGEK